MKNQQNEKPKLMTAKEVQQEFLPMDIRKVRLFLNANCRVRKIGNQYFYVREEIEKMLIRVEGNVVYHSGPQRERRRRRK